MSENRDLPEPTGDERVSRLLHLVEWLDREGGPARGIRIVRAVAAHDLRALRSGIEPKGCEPVQLCGFLAEDGDVQAKAAIAASGASKKVDPGDLIRNARPSEALASRLPRLRADWLRLGLAWQPRLTRVVGGGRAIQSRYRLDFESVELATGDEPDAPAGSSPVIQYEVLQLKALTPFRWLFVQGGFEVSVRSWRGVTYFAVVLLTMLAAVVCALAGLVLLVAAAKGHGTVLASLLAVGCAYVFWRCVEPFLEVATQRIIKAPIVLLPMDEVFGQLKFVRRKDLKIPTGWLSLVRIQGQCPFCESEINLEEGGKDFPGRTVGRCREAPSEHVFSFDPTSNRGRWLRAHELQAASE